MVAFLYDLKHGDETDCNNSLVNHIVETAEQQGYTLQRAAETLSVTGYECESAPTH